MPETAAPDFLGLSERQVEALCDVAFGGDGHRSHPRTMTSLASRSLVEFVPMETPTPEGWKFRWMAYSMPLSVHIAFCEWCSAQEAVKP